MTTPQTAPAYPATERLDLVDDFHGTPVADPYRWLESSDDPRTQEWLAAREPLPSWLTSISPSRRRLRGM